jgi:hypothetical protein
MLQRHVSEDEIGFVIIDKTFKNTVFLGFNDIIVGKITVARIFQDKWAADNHLFQLKQTQPYFQNIYDNKLFEIKPVRVTFIYGTAD